MRQHHIARLRVLAAWVLSMTAFCSFGQAFQELDTGELPKWEAGLFVGGFNAPDYPGSAQNSNNFIGAPYIVYRGERFRMGDGSAARAIAYDKQYVELDISLDAAFNADSEDNDARRGMPDLDYLLEIGPQLTVNLSELWQADNKNSQWRLAIQARGVFSSDFSSFEHEGYVFQPELIIQHSHAFYDNDRLYFSIGPIWANQGVHDYLYSVDGAYATADRPEYKAESGYLGTEASLGYRFNINPNWRAFVGIQGQLLSGAANENSPLFEKNNTFSFGAGIVWRFYTSKETVSR